jgi:hypothetical protein
MGAFSRRAGGAAGAVLFGAGLVAVPSAAQARSASTVEVPCGAPALIAAIETANTVSSSVLKLAPFCTYTLTAPAATGTRGPDGLPIITGNITLEGQRRTTIDRYSAQKFRILEVAAGATLKVTSMVIAGGNGGLSSGGGILNANGTVVLTDSIISRNTADSGAGLSNDRGHLTLVNTSVTANTTGGGGGGGGIYNDGTLMVRRSKVGMNYANTSGGGIYNEQGGRATLIDDIVNGNGAKSYGGGIFNNAGSSTSMQQSIVYNNSVVADGAGIYNKGRLQLVRSRLTTNSATGNGGGTFNTEEGTEVFYSSQVDRNLAAGGGGVYNDGLLGNVTLHSSTITSNTGGNCWPADTLDGCQG